MKNTRLIQDKSTKCCPQNSQQRVNKYKTVTDMSSMRKINFANIPDFIQLNKEALQIAFYRQYLYSNKICTKTLAESIILGAQQAGLKINHSDRELNQLLQSEKLFIDSQTEQSCRRSLFYLIDKRHKFFSSEKGFRLISKNKQHIMQERMMNQLQLILEVNSDYSSIMHDRRQKLFQDQEISKLFECTPQTLTNITEAYDQNKVHVIEPSNQQILIQQLIFLKLKILIYKTMLLEQPPKEQQILKSQVHIKKYYQEKVRRYQKSQQIKQSLFQFCQKELYLCDLRLEKKQQIRDQLKQLAANPFSEQQIRLQIKKISHKYNVKQHLVYQQVNRIRKGSMMKMQKQSIAFQKAREYFNHYRIKYSLQAPSEILQQIGKDRSIRNLDIFRWSFNDQYRKIYRRAQEDYNTVCQRIIFEKIAKEQIVFIGCFHILWRQFTLWNILHSKITPEYAFNRLDPCDDIIYHSILGITARQVLFAELTSKVLTIQAYFDEISYLISKYKDKMPRTIAFYVPFTLLGIQLERLSKMDAQLRKYGKLLLLLPVNSQIPNIIREFEFILKYKLVPKLSPDVNTQNFETKLHLQTIYWLNKISQKGKVSKLIQFLWKR